MPPQNQDLSSSIFPQRSAQQPIVPPAPAAMTPPPTPPIAPISPIQIPPPVQTSPKITPKGGKKGLLVIIIILIVLIGGGIAFAYQKGFISFGSAPYSNDKLASSIVAGIAKIHTSSYSLNLSIVAQPKEADAQPLSLAVPTNPDLDLAYKRDQDRVRDMNSIVGLLTSYFYKNKNFPSTLSGIDTSTVGGAKNFTYARAQSGIEFTLSTTLETQNAIDSLTKSVSKIQVNGKTITISKDSGYYVYLPTELPKPAIFSFLNLQSYLSYIPNDFSLNGTVAGASVKASDGSINTDVHITGDANVSDSSFGVDVEAKKVGGNYYAVLTKFPTFFVDLSKIKTKWIKITPDDIASYGSGYLSIDSSQDNLAKVKADAADQLQLFLSIADKDQILLINGSPKRETIDGDSLYKYDLQFDQGKFAQFYTDLTSEFKAKYPDKPVFAFDQSTLDYLKSPEFSQAFDYFRKNTTLSIWATSSGIPIQISYGLRVVPESTKGPADHQVKLVLTLTLHDVNKTVTVDAPADTMSFEDAIILLSGQSKEQYEMGKQSSAISTIRYALSTYKTQVGSYPITLADLAASQNGAKVILKTVPTDVYTKTPFTYSASAGDYKLMYTEKLPVYVPGDSASALYTRDYTYLAKPKLVMTVVDGQNTADSKVTSEEAVLQSQKDTDADGVPDVLEKYLGTNPSKKDTDGDGRSDYDELNGGTNPLGPGNLKYSSSF